jgi:hypothetical protein
MGLLTREQILAADDIKKEPVQFAGWKQFTKAKNDKPTTPREQILRLWPQPLYIQIQ